MCTVYVTHSLVVCTNRNKLSVQTQVCAHLQRQIERQTVQLRATQREVGDLHTHLRHFQAALGHFQEGRRWE